MATLHLRDKINTVSGISSDQLQVTDSHIGSFSPICHALILQGRTYIGTLDLKNCKSLIINGNVRIDDILNTEGKLRSISIRRSKTKIPDVKGLEISIINWAGDIGDIPYNNSIVVDTDTLKNMGAKTISDRQKMIKDIRYRNHPLDVYVW